MNKRTFVVSAFLVLTQLFAALLFVEPVRAQLGMTNPVNAPDEPCYIQISDPNSTKGRLLLPDVYQLPPPEFLVNPNVNFSDYFNITKSDSLQTDSLHPFLRYYAQVAAGRFAQKVPPVLPSQILVDAVMIYMRKLPIGTTLSGTPLDPTTWALKLAQLAVTGRGAHANFRLWHSPANEFSGPQDADLIQLVKKTNPTIPFNQADLQQAVYDVLNESYSALWAIRSNAPVWRAKRAQMGWIAVSGEDDTPHRPVNVPTAPFPQYDLPVDVNGLTKVTRYMVASVSTFIGPDIPPAGTLFGQPAVSNTGSNTGTKLQSSGIAKTSGIVAGTGLSGQNRTGINFGAAQIVTPPRRLPIDDLPIISPGSKIIIYIHGGGSRLEEAVPLASWLITYGRGAQANQDYTVISLDLPNSAYGSSFDPSCVYDNCNLLPLNQYQPVPNYPILMFEKQYVLNFIDALDVAVGNVKNRIVAFMGGSLGGNLSLILGGLYTGGNPYLKTVVAWSPTAMLKTDGLSNLVVSSSWIGNLNTTNWGLEDGPHTRTDYFNKLYFQPISPQLGIPADPEMWFRADWPGYGTTTGASNGVRTVNLDCAKSNVTQSRFDRYEIYSQQIRRWTTAIDLEQAMYDFRNPGPDGREHYLDILARVLLATGDSDNYSNRPNQGGALEGAGAGAAAGALAGLALGGPIGGGVFGIVGGVVGLVYGSGAPTLNNVDIYGYTHDVANRMVNTPGRTLFIKDTGHSIHNERAQFFAQEIVNFLTTPDTTVSVNLAAGDTGLRWNSQVWAAFLNKSNQPTLTIELNALWHPWNPNPPAVDNPCGLCGQLHHFEFPPDSWHGFTVDLSRTGINLADIQGLDIQFIGGSRGPTDTADHFDLTGVTLVAQNLGGLIGPEGMGIMFSGTGSSSAPTGPPLKSLQSPQDFWQTTNITTPQPPIYLPTFYTRMSSGTDPNGPYAFIGNIPNGQTANYWTQVPTWITVTAVDGSNHPVQGNLSVVPLPPPPSNSPLQAALLVNQVEGVEVGVLPGGSDVIGPSPIGRKVYYMCLPAGTPVNGSSGQPPSLTPFPGNQRGCWVEVYASGYKGCVLPLDQIIAAGGVGGTAPWAPLQLRQCPAAPATGPATITGKTATTSTSSTNLTLQNLQNVQLPLSASACPTLDRKSCLQPGQAGPRGSPLMDIVTVTSNGTPVGGATVSVSGQNSTALTNASGVAVITYQPCVTQTHGPTGVPVAVPTPCGATASKPGYQPFGTTLP